MQVNKVIKIGGTQDLNISRSNVPLKAQAPASTPLHPTPTVTAWAPVTQAGGNSSM